MTCEKRGYTSRRIARQQARRIGSEAGHPMRAYACPDCGRWHLSAIPGDVVGIVVHGQHDWKRRAPIARGARPARGQSIEDLAAEMRRRGGGE